MSTTIQTAAREYATRPKDERFASLADMVKAAELDRTSAIERTYNLRDLRAVTAGNNVQIASPKNQAALTHWSFGQLARMIGAPAGYLRHLPAALAADCINHGITEMPAGQTAALMLRAGQDTLTARSINTETYKRVWDGQLYSSLVDRFTSRDPKWTTPPTWSGEPAGAYRGDRDSFVILTNGGSIVNDPSARNNDGQMYRGLLIRNSEVGAASVTIEQILFRYVCGNHMLWGAVVDKRYRRRHVGSVLRDTIREIHNIAYRWSEQSPARDEAIIRGLIAAEIATTRAAVIDELQSFGATESQATAAYDRCEQMENASPRSYWGIAQGFTRTSQDSGYQDDRYTLDKLAATVLARGRQLVTV